MARTALAVQQIVRTGLEPTYSNANAEGHAMPNGGTEVLHVKNGDESPINVTIQTPNTVDGLAIADRVVAVPAGEERFIGPFPRATYNQGADEVYVDFSAVTSVTCAALRL